MNYNFVREFLLTVKLTVKYEQNAVFQQNSIDSLHPNARIELRSREKMIPTINI